MDTPCICMSYGCLRNRGLPYGDALSSSSQRNYRRGNSPTIPEAGASKALIKLCPVHGYAWASITK